MNNSATPSGGLSAGQVAKLNAYPPAEQVWANQDGFSYVEGWYVIDQLNEVFGHGEWSFFAELKQTSDDRRTKNDREGWDVSFMCKGRLLIHATGAVYEDVGFGSGVSYSSKGAAVEGAIKEARTDTIKRCAVNLGNRFALCLYNDDCELHQKARRRNKRNNGGGSGGGGGSTSSVKKADAMPAQVVDRKTGKPVFSPKNNLPLSLVKVSRVVYGVKKSAPDAAKQWEKHGVEVVDAQGVTCKLETFRGSVADFCKKAAEQNVTIFIEWDNTKYGLDLKDAKPMKDHARDEPHGDPDPDPPHDPDPQATAAVQQTMDYGPGSDDDDIPF